jgi:hypothetical protein
MDADDGRVRLTLSEARTGDSLLDGAWWPRSNNPLIELPLLVAELASAVGAVKQLSLGGAGWTTTPRTVPFDRSRVDVCWFSPEDSHEIVVTTATDVVLDLLLVPPATSPITALAAMAAATRGTNAARGSELLAAHGAGTG